MYFKKINLTDVEKENKRIWLPFTVLALCWTWILTKSQYSIDVSDSYKEFQCRLRISKIHMQTYQTDRRPVCFLFHFIPTASDGLFSFISAQTLPLADFYPSLARKSLYCCMVSEMSNGSNGIKRAQRAAQPFEGKAKLHHLFVSWAMYLKKNILD